MEDSHVPFKGSFTKVIGDGSNTLFWHDHWIGEVKLCMMFPRLYNLEQSALVTVSDRVPEGGFAWNWRRTPTGRAAREFEDLILLLSSFIFDRRQVDKWKWSIASDGIFRVKTLATELDMHSLPTCTAQNNTLRNNLVPKKIEIFVWRALKKRLPVRLELDKRGIDLHSVRCPLCDDDLESVDHSLIFCKNAFDVWERVFKWWNLGNFLLLSLHEIFEGNANLNNTLSGFGKKIWQASMWCCAYLIWKNQNNMVFQNKCWNAPLALNEIQVKSFEWVATRSARTKIDWHTWLSNPSFYFSIS
ncbi:uncharacterized protein [Rutidosis leptorrhynchoides]|uniref:uncharacterized protein n=1 Tax=Rutidosis leptorrhynchoides TaxID=125765 RepID=UPI003A9A4B38